MTDVKGHKKYLGNLEEADPEFFAYLKENDEDLLKFEDSDAEVSDDEDDEDGGLHKPPEDLEVASDSEAEEEMLEEGTEASDKIVQQSLHKKVVNLHVISHWEKRIAETRDLSAFVNVVDALGCAVATIIEGSDAKGLKWKIEGSANFNALIRLCIREVKGFCARYICGSNNQDTAESLFDNKPFETRDRNLPKWRKLRRRLKAYMESIVKFLRSAGSSDALAAVLRHVQKMSGFWSIMSLKANKIIRVLVSIWSQGEDTCRVLAFLTLIKITNYNRSIFLPMILKRTYIAYVANSKFTSVNTWPAINFMRNSLVEFYLLDTSISYAIGFPFIRQLAIHLRNAVTAGTGLGSSSKQTKLEASRVIYSWQFMHSLHAWADLLSHAATNGDENLKLLIYPVVQICMGTIRLIPSKKFIPLRFHIIKMMIQIQDKTKTYIPILPLITEVLQFTDFSAKSVSKFSVRPIDLTCCLKAEPSESGYLKAVSNNIFDCYVGAISAISTELSFPEIVTPTVIQLKSFVKKQCKNIEMAKNFKNLLDKVEENSAYIKKFRDRAMDDGDVSLADQNKMQILRIQMMNAAKPPPFIAYAADHTKKYKIAAAKLRAKRVGTKEENMIPKPKAGVTKKKVSEPQSDQLFDDSDEDFTTKLDDEEPESFETSKKRKKNQNTESDSEEPVPKKKLKKKMKVKAKAKKKMLEDTGKDVEDQVLDLDLSD